MFSCVLSHLFSYAQRLCYNVFLVVVMGWSRVCSCIVLPSYGSALGLRFKMVYVDLTLRQNIKSNFTLCLWSFHYMHFQLKNKKRWGIFLRMQVPRKLPICGNLWLAQTIFFIKRNSHCQRCWTLPCTVNIRHRSCSHAAYIIAAIENTLQNELW